jgi:formate dehydrogenase major subunit
LKGRVLHQIGIPYHWSGSGLVRGDAANELISFAADPNVSIMESKALTVAIEPGRRKRGARSRLPVPDLPSHQNDRDLPQARQRRKSSHDYETEQMKEGHS